MRKSLPIGLGLIASLAMAGGAAAQNAAPSHTLQTNVSPSKAGTTKKPKAVTFTLGIANNRESGTTAKRIEIFFPTKVRINPKGFKTCSASKIENDGPGACPKASRLGSGTAAAVVNPTSATPASIKFKNTFFVSSSKSLSIYLEQTGGDVRAILNGKITKAGGNKYGQKLSIDIPENLQQPAPGVYSALTDIKTVLKGTTGSGSKKHGIFESTGCTGGLYDFQTRLSYAPNPNPPANSVSTATDSVVCKR